MAFPTYLDVHSSCLRFCSDFISSVSAIGPLTLVDFDAHADLQEMPAGDLIGVQDFTITRTSNSSFMADCQFGVVTQNDANAFRLNAFISGLEHLLIPGSNFPVYNASSGVKIANAHVTDGTTTLKAVGAKDRPARFILASMGFG